MAIANSGASPSDSTGHGWRRHPLRHQSLQVGSLLFHACRIHLRQRPLVLPEFDSHAGQQIQPRTSPTIFGWRGRKHRLSQTIKLVDDRQVNLRSRRFRFVRNGRLG